MLKIYMTNLYAYCIINIKKKKSIDKLPYALKEITKEKLIIVQCILLIIIFNPNKTKQCYFTNCTTKCKSKMIVDAKRYLFYQIHCDKLIVT
ncbi:hypothetical protein V1478_004911 [Vespula squamosa]|uniref:Uncharacterized protein n=1 Tax=Vespula squamosa TaxID=30214 RepID=A0ABD2BF42_VESSQ